MYIYWYIGILVYVGIGIYIGVDIYKWWCWHLDIIWSHWTAEYDCIEYDCIELQNMIALDCKYGLHWLVHWLLTLDCIGLHWIELHWIALDCIGLDCIGLHWTKVAYIGLHWHWMWFECLHWLIALNYRILVGCIKLQIWFALVHIFIWDGFLSEHWTLELNIGGKVNGIELLINAGLIW